MPLTAGILTGAGPSETVRRTLSAVLNVPLAGVCAITTPVGSGACLCVDGDAEAGLVDLGAGLVERIPDDTRHLRLRAAR